MYRPHPFTNQIDPLAPAATTLEGKPFQGLKRGDVYADVGLRGEWGPSYDKTVVVVAVTEKHQESTGWFKQLSKAPAMAYPVNVTMALSGDPSEYSVSIDNPPQAVVNFVNAHPEAAIEEVVNLLWDCEALKLRQEGVRFYEVLPVNENAPTRFHAELAVHTESRLRKLIRQWELTRQKAVAGDSQEAKDLPLIFKDIQRQAAARLTLGEGTNIRNGDLIAAMKEAGFKVNPIVGNRYGSVLIAALPDPDVPGAVVFHAGLPMPDWARWQAYGFTNGEAREWAQAGAYDRHTGTSAPDKAAQMSKAGLTAHQVRALTPLGGTGNPATLASKFCSGDLPLSQVKSVLNVGEIWKVACARLKEDKEFYPHDRLGNPTGTATLARQWDKKGFDAAEARGWMVKGFCYDPEIARALQKAGVTSQEAGRVPTREDLEMAIGSKHHLLEYSDDAICRPVSYLLSREMLSTQETVDVVVRLRQTQAAGQIGEGKKDAAPYVPAAEGAERTGLAL